jgi:hypothetical protein
MASGGDEMTRPPPTYVDHAIGCAPKSLGKGCENGVCAPKVSGPFGSATCIYQTGQTMCPSGYAKSQVVMTSFTDTRACNTCGCGAASHRCNVDVRFHGNAACSDDLGGVSDVCFDPNGVGFIEVIEESPCNAQGGGQGGGVVASQPVTVCCP